MALLLEKIFPAGLPYSAESFGLSPSRAKMSLAAESRRNRRSGAIADFGFLPKALTATCSRLIESHHEVHGYSTLAEILWHGETRDFIALHESVQQLFRKASITRSGKKANECYVTVATIILSLEILASGFAGWGERFPAARRRANLLLGNYLPNSRTHLTDTYLYRRWGYSTAMLSAGAPSSS
jgi:hypothetical protein